MTFQPWFLEAAVNLLTIMPHEGSDRRAATLFQADRGVGERERERQIFPGALEGERKTSPAGLRDSRHDPRPMSRLSIRIVTHERDGDGAASARPSKHETARRRKTSDATLPRSVFPGAGGSVRTSNLASKRASTVSRAERVGRRHRIKSAPRKPDFVRPPHATRWIT